MERGLTADLSVIHAWRADLEGNLVYRKTARNFNPMMATAGRVTVAEVENLVEPGTIDPDHIHTPGIFVHASCTARPSRSGSSSGPSASAAIEAEEATMAWITRRDGPPRRGGAEDGFYVNLGIGIPTLVSNYIPAGIPFSCRARTACSGWAPFRSRARRMRI